MTVQSRILALVSAVSLLFSLSACSSGSASVASGSQNDVGATSVIDVSSVASEASAQDTTESQFAPASETQLNVAPEDQPEADSDVSFEETTILDNGEFVMMLTEYDTDGDWGPTFTVYIENNSDKDVMVSVDDVSVNGMMCDPFWACEVTAGNKTYSEISWSDSALQSQGINYIQQAEGVYRIRDTESDEKLVEGTFSVSLSGGSGDATEPRSGSGNFSEAVIVDSDQATVKAVDYDPDGEWGSTFILYLENKTNETVMFSVESASVNGFMCDPYWAEEVAPGKAVYSEMYWSDSSLEESRIESIQSVEIDIQGHASDSWDTIFETTATLSVEE